MCNICAAFNPHLLDCEYQSLINDGAGEIIAAPGDTVSETGDAAANSSTSASFAAGEYFEGTLSRGTETDWVEITLEAGTYTIAGTGIGPLDTAVNDITLTLRNEDGVEIDSDDVSGPDLNAELTVSVTETTTLFIEVGSFFSSDSGAYGLSVTEGTIASYSDNMASGNLIRPNQAWVTEPGTEVDITWAFRASGNDPARNTPLVALNSDQRDLTLAAMAYTDAISGLNFTQVAPGGNTNNATILVGAYDDPSHGAGAYAFFPGSDGGNTASSGAQGDIWLNNDSFHPNQSYGLGTYTNYTMLHEIGHAIGLAHPGQYNAGSGGPITYSNSAQFIQDSMQYTVMSYFDETNTGVSRGLGFPDTFMLHDFMAIHQLYGANVDYNAGNTIYGFNATDRDSVYDFTFNTTPFMTIYDGQGTDLIDLSGYTSSQTLSLEEGVFSNIGGYVGNFTIAYGAVIENATGGDGADTITGNDASNVLDGGDGADVLYGGLGDDILQGGGQTDYLEGGEGHDSLSGGVGMDTIEGGEGNDFAFGGQGNDLIMGGTGHDRLLGAKGNDTVYGGDFNDRVLGNQGDDFLYGEDGDDVARGGRGSDYIEGGLGNDSLFGGSDFDTLDGGEGNDTLTGNFNADQFVFKNNHGKDEITDFHATNDFEKIDFSELSSLNSLDDVLGTETRTGAATQSGNDVIIDTGSNSSVLLKNVVFTDLDAADFIF